LKLGFELRNFNFESGFLIFEIEILNLWIYREVRIGIPRPPYLLQVFVSFVYILFVTSKK